MAVGLGVMTGFALPRNFRIPYASLSVTEFWRCWHMSLSAWLRDYVYIPLGGSRVSPGRTYVNLWAVFLLCGLWHGANWTFVIWGVSPRTVAGARARWPGPASCPAAASGRACLYAAGRLPRLGLVPRERFRSRCHHVQGSCRSQRFKRAFGADAHRPHPYGLCRARRGGAAGTMEVAVAAASAKRCATAWVRQALPSVTTRGSWRCSPCASSLRAQAPIVHSFTPGFERGTHSSPSPLSRSRRTRRFSYWSCSDH